MKKILPKIQIAAVACTAVLFLSGCKTDDIVKKELELFNDANYRFTNGKYDLSRKYYKQILDEFPDSPFQVHALLGVADSYYMNKEYEMSETSYESFVELYPMTSTTDHALFYKAMSHYQSLGKIPRDQTPAQKAKDLFEQFIIKYPDHSAIPFAKSKIAELTDMISRKDIYIIEFYYQIDSFVSCISRAEEFVAKHPKSRYAPKALLLKGKSYMKEEAFSKARNTFQRIVENFAETKEALQAKAALEELKKLKNS